MARSPNPDSTDLPPKFIERMELLLGAELPQFLRSFDIPASQGLRINPMKSAPAEIASLLPWTLAPVDWCNTGFTLDSDTRPGKHPLHAAGTYYVQEPSAMAVAEALDVRPGHLVMDIAASPGGKTTHIAGLLDHRGVLVANDPIPGRIKALGENLERYGARNALLTNSTAGELATALPGLFDRVLVDAPCSGEGMFRKSPVAIREWSEEHVRGCAARQALLLDDAACLVKPEGLLLYSTCTFAPEENEEQICRFLNRHPSWVLTSIQKTGGMGSGRPDWATCSELREVDQMARIWPHLATGEGHAIALLRAPDASGPDHQTQDRGRVTKSGEIRAGQEAIASWNAFQSENLPGFTSSGELVQRRDHLFLLPEGGPAMTGVRVVRPGLPLGIVKQGRFEPSHALALAFPANTFAQTLDLDHEQALDYLQGESIRAVGPPGWVVVTNHGFPIGWGKRSGSVLKNHYPKGLRW